VSLSSCFSLRRRLFDLSHSYMEAPCLDAVRTLLVLHHFWTQQESPSAPFLLIAAIQIAQVS
jgi:hypothetical protein